MINLYRLATTELGLETGFLYSHGVFKPSNGYTAYSTKVASSVGGQNRAGFKNDTWQWLGLTPTQVFQITQIVEDSLANFSGLIYATLPKANGENSGQSWVDVSAQVTYPEVLQVTGALNGLVLQSTILNLNNITIINDPSTVVQ